MKINELELIELRDIGVLSNAELEEIIEHYKKMHDKKREKEQYCKYEKILKELKEMGYFSDTQYTNRTDILKKHYLGGIGLKIVF